MIYLYYTGAKNYLQPQNEIAKSIGGYISNTLIPKDILNNLFSDITNFSIKKNKTDTKCIAIKNASSSNIVNMSVSASTLSTNAFEYEFAFVQPTTDACNANAFELLTNSEQIPYYANFITLTTPQVIAQLNAEQYIGLFIKRKLKQTTVDNPCLTTDELLEQIKQEELILNITW